jgi:hypothetical protein
MKDWRPHQTCRYTEEVEVIIGDQTWKALSYRQHGLDRIYAIGELPEGWSRNDKHKIMLDGEEWHIVSYLDNFDEIPPRAQMFHPWGNHWIMEKHRGYPFPWPTMEATVS